MIRIEKGYCMEIEKVIGDLRRQRGMTLKELSGKSAVSVSLLSMVERDRSNMMKYI
jgi:transcriptional regulator with XRE-family HTH domain